jgi:hypothetical protein
MAKLFCEIKHIINKYWRLQPIWGPPERDYAATPLTQADVERIVQATQGLVEKVNEFGRHVC